MMSRSGVCKITGTMLLPTLAMSSHRMGRRTTPIAPLHFVTSQLRLQSSLADSLRHTAEKVGDKLPKAMFEQMEQRAAEGGLHEKALKVGDTAPSFGLTDVRTSQLFISDEALKQGPLVVVFCRGSWCPFCRQTLEVYEKMCSDFEAKKSSIVVITSEEFLDTRKANEIAQFPVVLDRDLEIAKKFGVAMTLAEEDINAHRQAFDYDLKSHSRDEIPQLPIPATFVIGQDHKILHRHVNVDFREREDPQHILDKIAGIASRGGKSKAAT